MLRTLHLLSGTFVFFFVTSTFASRGIPKGVSDENMQKARVICLEGNPSLEGQALEACVKSQVVKGLTKKSKKKAAEKPANTPE